PEVVGNLRWRAAFPGALKRPDEVLAVGPAGAGHGGGKVGLRIFPGAHANNSCLPLLCFLQLFEVLANSLPQPPHGSLCPAKLLADFLRGISLKAELDHSPF